MTALALFADRLSGGDVGLIVLLLALLCIGIGVYFLAVKQYVGAIVGVVLGLILLFLAVG